MSKRTRRFGKHSHNPKKVLRRAALDYSNTHRQFISYLQKCIEELDANRAHVALKQLPSAGNATPKVTLILVRARAPGEQCEDFQQGRDLLFHLATGLNLGQDVGKVTITPRGTATEIMVTRHTNA